MTPSPTTAALLGILLVFVLPVAAAVWYEIRWCLRRPDEPVDHRVDQE